MTFDEFAELEAADQEKWLIDKLAECGDPDGVYAALGTDKGALGKIGIFYVPPRKAFMIKPMRGYQTTKLSGNESETDSAQIALHAKD